jgi:hypothetical protein
VHHFGVMIPGKDIAGATHIGSKLINFVKVLIEHMSDKALISKVTSYKIIGGGVVEPRILEVDTAHPKLFFLQSPHQVVTNEPAGSAD